MEEIRFNVWKAVKFKNLKKNSNAILTCVVFLFEVIIYKKKKKKILMYDINGRYKITGN